MVDEFFRRSALLFCSAIRCGIPLRGAISVGEAVLNSKENVFIGQPLVEASSLEAKLDCVAVGLCAAFQSVGPIFSELVQIADLPVKTGGEKLYAGIVLDWPSVWQRTFLDSPEVHIRRMMDSVENPALRARYQHAIDFVSLSAELAASALPDGFERITVEDVWAAALSGMTVDQHKKY